MTNFLFRLVVQSFAIAALGLTSAVAAITITDGPTTIPNTCTGVSTSVAGDATTVTFTPNPCLNVTTSTTGQFSLRLVPTATTQPSTGGAGAQTVLVYVDAGPDVPLTTAHTLTLNLCTSAQQCNGAASDNWYFFPYAELGGAGFTPQDRRNTGNFQFTFQAGANPGSAGNARSMGIGHMDVPNAPLFSGTRTVMYGLSGTRASTTVVTHTITGGQQLEGDRDVTGALIPDPTGPIDATNPCEIPPNAPHPGSGTGPCGAYEVAVRAATNPAIDCSAGMNSGQEILKAWQYNQDYNFGAVTTYRLGIQPRHAFSFRIRTPSLSSAPANWFPHAGGIAANGVISRGSVAGGIYISISEKRCDFNRATLAAGPSYSACHSTGNNSAADLGFKVRTNSDNSGGAFECTLRPDKYYYINIRFEQALTAPGNNACDAGASLGGTCGVTFGMN